MSIISFSFLLFLIDSIIIYYLFPKKHRWTVLLFSSVLFFICACDYKLFLYLIFDILVAYFGTKLFSEEQNEKTKKGIYFSSIFLIIGVLITLKWINIVAMTFNIFGNLFHIHTNFGMLNLIAPLGVSYYTLSLIGYVTDVYRGAYEREKNIFKLALFTCYYPILISGPFVRYSAMKKELFEEKQFSYINIFQGFERIIYGFMKKILIADVLSGIVSTIFSNYYIYSGYYIVLGLVCYAIQIYADFSGCMDIVIGASKMYGITLEENFKSPFLSKNLSEFWRRWHISLGQWGKDYIMYPLLKSNAFQKLNTKLKDIYGKKPAKLITTLLSIFILWLFIGIWHGASYRYIFCAGILPWIYLTCGQLFETKIKLFNEKFHIRTECFSFQLFRRLRTLGFMCFIWLFACADRLKDSVHIIRQLFHFPSLSLMYTLPKFSVLGVGIALGLVLVVDILKYQEIDVLEMFNEQNTIFKYLILFLMIYLTLRYGAYGPSFNAVDFIYGGF